MNKKELFSEKASYVSPVARVAELKARQMLCQSGTWGGSLDGEIGWGDGDDDYGME